MRRAMKPAWLEIDGNVIGINLGADFCSEHECGIAGLRRTLGLDGAVPEYGREKPTYSKPHGLPRRMITRHDAVKLYEHGGIAALLCEDRWWFKCFDDYVAALGLEKALKEHLPSELPRRSLGTAWCDANFGIYAEGPHVDRVKDLYQAFQADNIGLWIGGSAIGFDNGGLILCIADRIPPADVELLKAADLKRDRLAAASDATGILERLRKAGKGFFACTPRFSGAADAKRSAHPVVYWLNPTEQDRNNFGWFTVEELDQWIQGTGPIPMAAAGKAKR